MDDEDHELMLTLPADDCTESVGLHRGPGPCRSVPQLGGPQAGQLLIRKRNVSQGGGVSPFRSF